MHNNLLNLKNIPSRVLLSLFLKLSFVLSLILYNQFTLADISKHDKPVVVKEAINDMKRKLIDSALQAREKAYSPYSNYKVGAALLTKSGKIFTGSNIENASYGLSSCAERNTIFKAVTEGEKDFVMIAVVTEDGGYSCGACRQVMNEFNPQLIVIIADSSGNIIRETKLSSLLPHAFGPSNLEK